MKIFLKLCFSLVCVCCVEFALGQSEQVDTSRTLQEVNVVAPRFETQQIGISTTEFTPKQLEVYRHRNIADLLADESPIFIKSYGLGSLATTALRGGSANHTAVLWNGISISSPMNGQLDLSLLPITSADGVYLQQGAGSALFGSGAVAGVIHLKNSSQFNQGTRVNVGLSGGSFSDFRQNVFVEYSDKKWVSSVKFFNNNAKNDFLIRNNALENNDLRRQTHAELWNTGVISENLFLLTKHQTLSLNVWLQSTERNLPPVLLQSQSAASQSDFSNRMQSEWKYSKYKLATFVRVGWLRDQLVFKDDFSGINDTSITNQLVAEAEAKYNFNPNHELNIGIHTTYATASHPSFENNPQQSRRALFGAYQFQTQNKRLQTRLTARLEAIDGLSVPATYSAGADYQLFKNIILKASSSKVYRIPTFNDLFWIPGGNPNLLPESGWAHEGGLHVKSKYKNLIFNSQITLFSREMNNWIIWLPNISFWSPQNLMQVWSRGVESQSSLSYQISNLKFSISVLTNYVISENLRSKSQNDASVGRQLIYTPLYSGMAKFGVDYKNLQFQYRHNYTGIRYTSTDNFQYLEPFDLGAIQASYVIELREYPIRFFFEINNLWNKNYQIISQRPMPGRNFHVGISIQFNDILTINNSI